MGPNGITQIGSFMVYSVGENGETELLGTLDGIELVEVITKTEPEEEEKEKDDLIFSLLQPDEATFTVKMTFWTRIRLWLWWKKLEIQKWRAYRKFKRSFDKAAKLQAKYEKTLKGEE